LIPKMAEEPLDAESQALEEVRLLSISPFHITAMISISNALLCNALFVSSGSISVSLAWE
jgi:hypothetical protein